MDLYSKDNITMATAVDLAVEAIRIANEMNIRVCATVVDSSGVQLASLREDRANHITPSSALKKAYTAAAIKTNTLHLADALKDNMALSQMSSIDDKVIVYGGGVPIAFNGNIVGAIGIAGAPGGNIDNEIAEKAIAAVIR